MSFRFPVEAGHIAMFTRAIGDPNPVYVDPAAARAAGFDSVLAPPTFIEAGAHFDPCSEVRPQPGTPWFGSGATATGDPERESRRSGSTFHAETHLELHRHPVAGDVLTATTRPGRTWEREGSRGGVLTFRDWFVDYTDQADALVVVARTVAVTTEQTVPPSSIEPPVGSGDGEDPTALVERPPFSERSTAPPAAATLSVGQTHAAVVLRHLTRAQIVQYAGASGDFSPQHTDEYYNVHAAGYPTVFAHGMLTMAATGRLLTDWLGDGSLRNFGLRFLTQVWPGDSLLARATVRELRPTVDGTEVDLDIETVNQHDEPVVRGGATVWLSAPRP